MSPTSQQQIEALFDTVLELSPGERAAYLDRVCGDDPAIREELESLVRHAEQSPPDFMRPPNPPSGMPSIREDSNAPDPLIGQKIGQYKIQSVIASGGMGTVYEAEQESPKRTVAVKVMKSWAVSSSARRRFEFESQVLARLTHPNIAQIYEAGTHAGSPSGPGVPYFVMEFVPVARTIIEHANAEGLSIRDRLALFTLVCEAVQHGHQKGIVHRDLKPGNILVSESGQLKVIDFGIARATDSDVAVTTMRTDVGQLLGTLQYMSPEQCEADPLGVDSRSDVYSLGVVLFELLCGQLPYNVKDSSIHLAARVVCEEFPTRPSSISRKLRGDLEAIVLMALEKERERRYQSVASLASDIQRYLRHEPIEATRYTLVDQARLFAKRHRAAFAAIIVTFGILLAATLISSIFAISANRQRQEAAYQAGLAAFQAYAANLQGAQAAIEADDVGTALQSLEKASEDLRGWEWHHLRNRLDESIGTLIRADLRTSGFAVTNNGQDLVVFGAKEDELQVSLFDAASISLIEKPTWSCILNGPRFPSEAIGYGGKLIAFSSRDAETVVTVLAIDDERRATFVARWIESGGEPSRIAICPNRPILAIGVGNEVRLRDLADYTEGQRSVSNNFREFGDKPPLLGSLHGHTRRLDALAFSPDGSLLASASVDCTARIWNIDAALRQEDRYEPAVLAGHTDHVTSVAFSPDGLKLATGSVDKTIRLWDVRASVSRSNDAGESMIYGKPGGELIGVLNGHTAAIMSVGFNQSGNRLVSGGGDKTIRVWDVNDRAPSSDAYGESHWLTKRRNLIAAFKGHAGWVNKVAFLAGDRIVSASADGTVKLWMAGVEVVPTLQGHFSSVTAVGFSTDGRQLVSAGGGYDGSIVVWDVPTCTPMVRRFLKNWEWVADLEIFERGGRDLLITASRGLDGRGEDGSVSVWNLRDLDKPICVLPNAGASCMYDALGVSRDGSRVAASNDHGFVDVWDIEKIKAPHLVAHIQANLDRAHSLLFLDDDGAWLVVGVRTESSVDSQDYSLVVWHVDTERPASRHPGHSDAVYALVMSPDRRVLASASSDSTVRLWRVDWSHGTPVLSPSHVLRGHGRPVRSLAFHPTENRLVSGADDGTIKIWDYERGYEVLTLRGQIGPVADLAFDAFGKRLASASGGFFGSDNVPRLWERNCSKEDRINRALHRWAQDAVYGVFQTDVASPDAARNNLESGAFDLPTSVRDLAVQNFDKLRPHPEWFRLRAWRIAGNPSLSQEAYRKVLPWALAAAAEAVENDRFHLIVATLQYRLHRFEEALTTLRHPSLQNGLCQQGGEAISAMIYHQNGNHDQALERLDRVRELQTEGSPAWGVESRVLAAEARRTIAGIESDREE